MSMKAQEAVLGDSGLVSQIVAGIKDSKDRASASLVSTLWNEAVKWTSSTLSPRSSSSIVHLAPNFPNVTILDLIWCCETLEDSDLELVARSFKYLKVLCLGNELRRQEKITNQGLESIARGCRYLETLSLACLSNILDQGIEAICLSCKSLSSLSLEDCVNLTDLALRSLSACSRLNRITLEGRFRFTETGLAYGIGACREMVKVSLHVGFLDIDPTLVAMASGCSKLQEVVLKFRNGNLRGLVACSSLRVLSISVDQRSALDSVLVDVVEANRQLVEFTYRNSWCPLNESTIIHVLMKCPRLRKFQFDAGSLSDAVLMSIVHCTELEHLALDSSGEGVAQVGLHGLQLRHFSAHGIRDVDMQTLLDGKRLEHLDLQGCSGLTPITFAAIGSCSSLQHLNLSFTKVDDIGLSQIAMGVKNLKALILVKCEAISSSYCLGLFPTLECLQIDQSPFATDVGLEIVADRCKSLKVLSLGFTNVTDSGLLWLLNCSDLRVLGVPYCRGVAGEGIIGLGRAMKLRLVVLSHRFRDSEVANVLAEKYTLVRFEVDDMALIPFGL